MASPARRYQGEMHDKLGFFATWLPADPIEVGDIGLLEGGRFRRITSLRELGVTCTTETGAVSQDLQYTSTHGTSMTSSAGADAAVVEAEISIKFSKAGAFVFHASGLRMHRIETPAAVGMELLRLHRDGRWDGDWLLVEALHSAKRATILVSEDASGELVLAAKTAGLQPILSLADPKISLGVASVRGSIVQAVSHPGLHPLYSCLRVRDPLFGRTSVHPVRGADDVSPEDLFVRPAIDELLSS
jgi:hypothetical protein